MDSLRVLVSHSLLENGLILNDSKETKLLESPRACAKRKLQVLEAWVCPVGDVKLGAYD